MNIYATSSVKIINDSLFFSFAISIFNGIIF